MKITRPFAWLPLVLVVCLTGCFDIGNTIELNEDLSGKASVQMTVDMNAMVEIMAGLKKQMSGGEGPVTPEELEAARKEFVEKKESEGGETMDDAKRKEIEESLPEGVTLDAIDVDDSDPLKIKVNITFAFDHVSKLAQIEMPGDDDEGAAPGPGNPIKRPFEGLVVEEGEGTLTIRFQPLNPAAKPEAEEGEDGEEANPGAAMMPGMDKMIEDAMKNSLKIRYTIKAPFEVTDSNATNKDEPHTQSWVYDFATLKKLEEAGAEAQAPHVTYKR